MARKEEAEKLLRQGMSPPQIAQEMGIGAASVEQYLRTRVGEGALRLSDIYFAIPEDRRREYERLRAGQDRDYANSALSTEEFELYASLRQRRVFAADMYEFVSESELGLHTMVKTALVAEFGETEDGWWRRGVAVEIRSQCQERREHDTEPCESPFEYSNLIDLSKIICANWSIFQSVLPKEYRSDRKKLEAQLRRLNYIRNSVMHPVKRREWTEDDFEFVRGMHDWLKPIYMDQSR